MRLSVKVWIELVEHAHLITSDTAGRRIVSACVEAPGAPIDCLTSPNSKLDVDRVVVGEGAPTIGNKV